MTKTKFCSEAVEFFVYSFCGWLYEVAAGFVINGRYEERGYLHLPVCVIYGFFTLAVRLFFNKKRSRPTNVFFISFVVVTLMEYVSSLVIENVLGRKLWDYSGWIWNIQGRVSFVSSIIFAVASVVLVFWAHPFLENLFTKKCMPLVTQCLGFMLAAAIVTDFIITTIT